MQLDRISLRLAAAMTMVILASAVAPAANEREILAPTGKLRIGVYPGSPTSMVQEARTGETHGLSVDLGKELAKRLDVPIEMMQFQRIADVLEAMRSAARSMSSPLGPRQAPLMDKAGFTTLLKSL